jgi:bifunctional non-homologous end joining protein LigD
LPTRQEPQLAEIAAKPPDQPGWIGELKLDGYRMIVRIEPGSLRLMTRRGLDWTSRMPRLAKRFEGIGGAAMLDGEIVALRSDGTSSFHDLQQALSENREAGLYFYAFDLLHRDGWDLRPCALIERKRLLKEMHDWGGYLRYTDHFVGDLAEFHQQACQLGAEGIVAKRADAPYRTGRRPTWRKVKCGGREELIVLGWKPPSGARQGLGSVVLGYYDPQGRLHYAGAVGTGFSGQELRDLRRRLDAIASEPPAALWVSGDDPERSIRWVSPELIAEISFTAWSGEGRVRHPVYLGLQEDKDPADVVLEVHDPEAPRRVIRPRK